MPIEGTFQSNRELINNRTTYKCPNVEDLSGTGTQFINVPIVYDSCFNNQCRAYMFETDPYLTNTNGCCVLDTSADLCTTLPDIDPSEEVRYDMGVRYFDIRNPQAGERKICYTAPISKKKLYIKDLMWQITQDILGLIVIVLIAACYEYWIIHGNCSISSIVTLLGDAPYSVNEYIMKREDNYKQKITSECANGDVNTNSDQLNWYDTFPYNIITFLNKPIIKPKKKVSDIADDNPQSTSKDNLYLIEVAKIPFRSLLLGFFYCIIISRLFLKAIVSLCSSKLSEFYNKNSKSLTLITGLVFILFFMGLWGNIADRFLGNTLPYLNLSCLFLLFGILIFTTWVPSAFGFIFLMPTFVGYRRGSYDGTRSASYWDSYMKIVDTHWLIGEYFGFKKAFTSEPESKLLITPTSDENKLINEEILDWFLPIRRSDLILDWYSKETIDRVAKLFQTTGTANDNSQLRLRGLLGILIEISLLLGAIYNTTVWVKWVLGILIILLLIPFAKSMGFYIAESSDTKNWEVFIRDSTKEETKNAIADPRSAYISANDNITDTINNCMKVLFFHSSTKNTWEYKELLPGLVFVCFRLVAFLLYLGSLLFFIFMRAVIIQPMWICLIIIVVFWSMMFGLLGNMFAFLYLNLYIVGGFFYVPFKNYTKLFKIIKSHGILLTILFCIIVVIAGAQFLHPTSAGVVGGLLALLILYKLINAISI